MTTARELAAVAARAAAEKNAHDVVVLDVGDVTDIADFFVIASGRSDRQVKTIVEEIEAALRSRGARPVRREGEREAQWVLLDFVDVIAHVFLDDQRDFYGLERLWGDAPTVPWEPRAASGSG